MNEPPGSLLAQMSEYGSRLCPFCQADMQQVGPAEWRCPRCRLSRMVDDKQRQVRAARDALIRPPNDCAISFERDGKCVGTLRAEIDGTVTFTGRADESARLFVQMIHELWLDDATREAIEALIAWHVTSGVDKGDRLRRAAQRLWLMQEKTRPPA